MYDLGNFFGCCGIGRVYDGMVVVGDGYFKRLGRGYLGYGFFCDFCGYFDGLGKGD